MAQNRNRAYSNNEIIVVWQARECTHSTICYNKLRSVFDPLKRPWIDMSGSTTEKILDIVEKCPTVALTFKWIDESRNEVETSKKLFKGSLDDLLAGTNGSIQNTSHSATNSMKIAESQATINIRANGPVVISGNFEVSEQGGDTNFDKWKMISLCRCGLSGNMPHCDGAHFKAGFTAK